MTRILCYHDVVAVSDRDTAGFPGPVSGRYKLSPAQFERHLDALVGADVREGLLDCRPEVALTFDDGGASALQTAAALERRGLRGHFFIATARIGAPGFLDADGVRELAARGHAIGSHSHSHPAYIERLEPAVLGLEWRTSRERLAELLGAPPKVAAVPGGRLSQTLIEQVAAAGYEVLLSCEPTARERRLGTLTVLGRYTIWARTSPARAAAYARGDRAACGWLRTQWLLKRAARAAGPATYERARRARATFGTPRSGADEPSHLADLGLDGGAPGALEPGRDQPPAQVLVAGHRLHRGGSGGGVARLDQQRAAAERSNPANGGGDGRRAARVRLGQHLRKALGARDVQEHVAPPVEIEQASVERDVSAQLAVTGQPAPFDARLERGSEVPLTAHDETPSRIPLAQQREDVREEQRVLLGIEPPDGQKRQLRRIVGAASGLLAGVDVGLADQGDGRVQDPRGVPVATRDVGAHRDHGRHQRERAPSRFKRTRGEVQTAAAGVAVADVGGEVLAHPEHEPASPDQRDQRQRDRVRVGAEREDRVGGVQRAPHPGERSRHGAHELARVREPRVMGQRDELDLVVERVVGGTGAPIQTAQEAQPAELPPQRADEADERALREHRPAPLAVEIVGVDDQPHGGRSARRRLNAPVVSVLIPVLDEGPVLDRTVPTMLAQRLDHGEIEFLFAEGRSRDDSRERLERFAARDPRVRVLDNPTGRTPDGLNVALLQSRGEFVARMDAHCFYPPTYLADGIARLERGDVAWVAGPAVPRADGGFSGTVALALCSPLGRGPSRRLARPGALGERESHLDTGVFAGVWRRSVLRRYGGWDPRWLRNQDSELAARFLADGHRIVSLPTMAAEYVPRRTLAALVRQYHDYGSYRALTLARHPIARRRSHALAPALVATLAAAIASPRAVRAPARAALGAYAAAVAVETTRASRTAPLKDAIGLPLAFAAMHGGWGIGMWRGFAAAWRSTQSFDSEQPR